MGPALPVDGQAVPNLTTDRACSPSASAHDVHAQGRTVQATVMDSSLARDAWEAEGQVFELASDQR